MASVSRVFLPALVVASTTITQVFASDICRTGFVWREAFAGDHVCVDPGVREQAYADNRLAASRRQPGGGQYGRDTCRQGFVWREAQSEDHVCVTPETRTQAAGDNRAASDRVVQNIKLIPHLVGAQTPLASSTSSAAARGFDDQGRAYIEEVLPDGSRRRKQRSGVTVIGPNGSRQFYPAMVVHSHVQAPTPPRLPDSDMAWINHHNEQLLELISLMVNNDAGQLALFHRGEDKQVGTDPFGQIGYRMEVLDDLAKP